MAKYKVLCSRCKNAYVPANWKDKYPTCYACDLKSMEGEEIKDPKMKRMFKIPEEYYKESSFLRKIKLNYFRYGNLTEPQIKAFKDVVKKLKNPPKDE